MRLSQPALEVERKRAIVHGGNSGGQPQLYGRAAGRRRRCSPGAQLASTLVVPSPADVDNYNLNLVNSDEGPRRAFGDSCARAPLACFGLLFRKIIFGAREVICGPCPAF